MLSDKYIEYSIMLESHINDLDELLRSCDSMNESIMIVNFNLLENNKRNVSVIKSLKKSMDIEKKIYSKKMIRNIIYASFISSSITILLIEYVR